MSVAIKLAPQTEPRQRSTALVSPFWDCFFVGGLALALYLLMAVMFQRNPPDQIIATYVFNLSFLFNFPHFLASYQLLYGDFRREIFRKPRYLFAGVGVPAILFGLFAFTYLKNPLALGYFLNAMYVLVGWHYTKQTFGVMVVANSIRGHFFSATERLWLKTNMYAVWFVAVASMNTGARAMSEFGFTYYSFDFPEWLRAAGYAAVAVAAGGVLITQLRRYVRDGSAGTPAAWIAYAAIYVFVFPALIHPYFTHMIPLFHSLQYMLFVYAFRRNKIGAITDAATPEGRRKRLSGIWGYLLGSVLLGAFGFFIIPGLLDTLIGRASSALPFMLMFTVFLNIHHYFIDHAIWRGDNEEMRRHLFQTAA